jgi:hypothetical protein
MKKQEFKELKKELNKLDRISKDFVFEFGSYKGSFDKEINNISFSFDFHIYGHTFEKKLMYDISNLYVYCNDREELYLKRKQEEKLYKIAKELVYIDNSDYYE